MACAHLLYRYQTRRLILGIITIREITKTCRFTDLYVKIHDGCTQKLLLPPQPLALQSCPLCPPQSVVILPFFVSTWCRLIFGENISPFSYTFVCFFVFFLNVCTKYLLQNLTKLLICLKNKKGFNISNDLKAPFFQSVGEHFLTIGLARTHAHTQTVKSVSAWFAFPRLFSVFHPKATSVAPMSGGTAQLSSNPEDDSMAYSSLFLIRCWSQNSGSLSRFMQVLAVGRRSRSVPPLWMQKAG